MTVQIHAFQCEFQTNPFVIRLILSKKHPGEHIFMKEAVRMSFSYHIFTTDLLRIILKIFRSKKNLLPSFVKLSRLTFGLPGFHNPYGLF